MHVTSILGVQGTVAYKALAAIQNTKKRLCMQVVTLQGSLPVRYAAAFYTYLFEISLYFSTHLLEIYVNT